MRELARNLTALAGVLLDALLSRVTTQPIEQPPTWRPTATVDAVHLKTARELAETASR